jgi:hypothetical protein
LFMPIQCCQGDRMNSCSTCCWSQLQLYKCRSLHLHVVCFYVCVRRLVLLEVALTDDACLRCSSSSWCWSVLLAPIMRRTACRGGWCSCSVLRGCHLSLSVSDTLHCWWLLRVAAKPGLPLPDFCQDSLLEICGRCMLSRGACHD